MADNLAYTQWKKEGRFERRVDARKWLNPPGKNMLPVEERGVWGEHMAQKAKQKQQVRNSVSAKLQSEGKTSLLSKQTTRKGGGSGGGGGKWGWIRRMVNRPASPWSLLKTDKNF